MSELSGVEVSILSYVIDDDNDMLHIIEQLLKANDIEHFHYTIMQKNF
jgi:FixJ family two-component response regulator